jgi:hypothetical protein
MSLRRVSFAFFYFYFCLGGLKEGIAVRRRPHTAFCVYLLFLYLFYLFISGYTGASDFFFFHLGLYRRY